MKRLLLSVFLLPAFAMTGPHPSPKRAGNLVEIRSGAWPMNLEREDASYSLIFRDQQYISFVVMDTLPFPNLEQLKYFGKALSTLKNGQNGDIAQFKDYSVKRAEKKFDVVQYILRIKFGLTDFQQPESDLMISTISKL